MQDLPLDAYNDSARYSFDGFGSFYEEVFHYPTGLLMLVISFSCSFGNLRDRMFIGSYARIRIRKDVLLCLQRISSEISQGKASSHNSLS